MTQLPSPSLEVPPRRSRCHTRMKPPETTDTCKQCNEEYTESVCRIKNEERSGTPQPSSEKQLERPKRLLPRLRINTNFGGSGPGPVEVRCNCSLPNSIAHSCKEMLLDAPSSVASIITRPLLDDAISLANVNVEARHLVISMCAHVLVQSTTADESRRFRELILYCSTNGKEVSARGLADDMMAQLLRCCILKNEEYFALDRKTRYSDLGI